MGLVFRWIPGSQRNAGGPPLIITELISFLGLAVLLWRTKPFRHYQNLQIDSTSLPKVSIIIPCRNEESNVSELLKSLTSLQKINPEIILVDDESTDQTVAIAKNFKIQVIHAPPKPPTWVGKSWACWHGANVATGDVLLFTDADTRHAQKSLLQALSFMTSEKANLISAPPFHLCKNRFEKFLGLFHILPMVAAAFNNSRNPNRLYAIGQYLLIQREAYFRIDGHKALFNSLTEDIDLAKAIINGGLNYSIFPDCSLYQVQMYDNFRSFLQGWKRLLRLGIKKVEIISFVEITLVFHLFVQPSIAMFFGVGALAWLQRKNGAFSIIGAPLATLSVILFTFLSIAAMVDSILKRKVMWRARSYADT